LVLIELEKTTDDFSFFQKAYANLTYETISDAFWSYETFITLPPKWEFEVKTYLKSWEKSIFPIEQSAILEIDEDYLDYIWWWKEDKISEKPVLSVIEVQWKKTKTKTIFSQKVVCSEVSECSVNFDGRKSQWNNLTYFWDYGNGKTYNKSNPWSYNFSSGKHIISLKVSDGKNSHISYFLVEVIPKIPKVSKTVKIKDNSQLSQINHDSQITQIPEWLQLKYHIFYSGLIFLLFLILSWVILRQKNII
jgi:hypothetical protein